MVIRHASIHDAPRLLALRNYYVENTIVVFDERPFLAGAIEEWVAKYSSTGPHQLLVAEDGGKLLGFCSSQRYRDHPAFDRTVEFGVTCDPTARGMGVGTALYGALLEKLAGEPLHRAVAGIALPNEASIALHRKFGFTAVGIFHEYAIKNGRFISSQWMERPLP